MKAASLGADLAKLVVHLSFLWVPQDLVGLADLLKTVFSLPISRVLVGMIF